MRHFGNHHPKELRPSRGQGVSPTFRAALVQDWVIPLPLPLLPPPLAAAGKGAWECTPTDTVMTPITHQPDPPIEQIGGVLSPIIPRDATPLERCDAEIATALRAVLYGLLPLDEALLYYRDWYWERKLILAELAGTAPPAVFSARRAPATHSTDSTSRVSVGVSL